MRDYEVTVILQPKLEEKERNELVESITVLLVPEDAEDGNPQLDVWGMRKMAYAIQKFSEGYYLHYNAKIDPARLSEIERSMQYMEDVIRYLIVCKED
ncbi:MAG: 30S ribosomal protein S6 [Anaerolineales bacterium]|nr:30S ribosomal protein S6 [Anaerolineales bacterium]